MAEPQQDLEGVMLWLSFRRDQISKGRIQIAMMSARLGAPPTLRLRIPRHKQSWRRHVNAPGFGSVIRCQPRGFNR